MTMAEFNIRLFSFYREREFTEEMFRRVGFAALVGSHQDPKSLPRTMQQYWSLPHDKKDIIDNAERRAEVIRMQQQQYNNRHNG